MVTGSLPVKFLRLKILFVVYTGCSILLTIAVNQQRKEINMRIIIDRGNPKTLVSVHFEKWLVSFNGKHCYRFGVRKEMMAGWAFYFWRTCVWHSNISRRWMSVTV